MNKVYSAVVSLALLLPYAGYANEVVYDSPEDLQATSPVPIVPAQTQSPAAQQQLAESSPPPMTLEQTKEKFSSLQKEISAGTSNLDKYFEYAQIATALGENKEAINAYNHMLKVDPSLQRVKLELALVKMRTGKLKESKLLFTDVLATNPPEGVQANIKQALAIVDKSMKPDIFSGSVTVGYNIDTNGNSASSSGQTTFVDNSLPLSTGSRAQRDGQGYATASLTHVHKFDIDKDFYKINWETTGTVYRAHQDTEVSLDIGLASLRTGPVFEFPDLKTKIGLNGTSSIIDLDANKYLRTRALELDVTYAMRDNLLFNAAYIHEYRKFINTEIALTYTDRSGLADQQNLGVTYALTPKDIFNTTLSWRYETAASEVYGSTQASITGSYTRQLPWELSFNTLLGFKKTNYHLPDPLVSASTLRHDRERTMTHTLAKKLPRNMTATTAYQYKNATSNIQNYKYSDHRYSVALGWGF